MAPKKAISDAVCTPNFARLAAKTKIIKIEYISLQRKAEIICSIDQASKNRSNIQDISHESHNPIRKIIMATINLAPK